MDNWFRLPLTVLFPKLSILACDSVGVCELVQKQSECATGPEVTDFVDTTIVKRQPENVIVLSVVLWMKCKY